MKGGLRELWVVSAFLIAACGAFDHPSIRYESKSAAYCTGQSSYPGHGTLEACKEGCAASDSCKCFTWRTDRDPSPTCSFEDEAAVESYDGYTSYVKKIEPHMPIFNFVVEKTPGNEDDYIEADVGPMSQKCKPGYRQPKTHNDQGNFWRCSLCEDDSFLVRIGYNYQWNATSKTWYWPGHQAYIGRCVQFAASSGAEFCHVAAKGPPNNAGQAEAGQEDLVCTKGSSVRTVQQLLYNETFTGQADHSEETGDPSQVSWWHHRVVAKCAMLSYLDCKGSVCSQKKEAKCLEACTFKDWKNDATDAYGTTVQIPIWEASSCQACPAELKLCAHALLAY